MSAFRVQRNFFCCSRCIFFSSNNTWSIRLCSTSQPGMPSVILATASYDHHIRFWEAPSGICYRQIQYTDSVNCGVFFSDYSQQINKLEITPDKQYIAAAGNPHIRFYEANTNNNNAVYYLDFWNC